ncbi:unnamed protein product [Brassica rapa]|uniref:Uncharacterized protein n=1 Tax=Brassica campestris TaxID=3711 RepID=A0A8D9I6G3_BRACM|nr:unnamed protein product [Brassica rapa]
MLTGAEVSKRLCDQYHGLVNERSNGEGVKKIAVNSIIELNGNTTDSQLMTKRIFDSEEIYAALHLDGSQC